MQLNVLVEYVSQQQPYLFTESGWGQEAKPEQLQEMLADAIDLYIAIRPRMQEMLERCNQEIGALGREMDLMELRHCESGLKYAICKHQLEACRESLHDHFDVLLKSAVDRGIIRTPTDEPMRYARLWSVEMVARVLEREAEAPFGVSKVQEEELRMHRDDVLSRLMMN